MKEHIINHSELKPELLYDMNFTLRNDELWINTNISEMIPDVYTPFTWSIGKLLDESLSIIPEHYILSGNIYGRPYMNISKRMSVIKSILGPFSKGVQRTIFDRYGGLPENMTIPYQIIGRSDALKMIVPKVLSIRKKTRKTLKSHKSFNTVLQKQILRKIERAESPEALIRIWSEDLKPYVLKAWLNAYAASMGMPKVTTLSKKLNKMVGPEDSCILMSNLRGNQELESLGVVSGISKVLTGEMTRDHYVEKYGHRGVHEYELSYPGSFDQLEWIDSQVKEYERLEIDIKGLLEKQRKKFDDAFVRFIERYPNKIMWIKKQLKNSSEIVNLREKVNSDFVRAYRLIREFALKAGDFSTLGDDVFLLYVEEVEEMLSGREFNKNLISVRRLNYEKYKSFPSFPPIIRGHFDPEEWVNDPNRRMDYYDKSMPIVEVEATDMLNGHSGAAGSVKGIVRVIRCFEDSHQLLPGEILVTPTINIGWTPLFPIAAAIITDIGVPFSHATIVAREMGIPAVVGCGNATIKLKTGDKVKVNGGQGTVEVL